MAEGKVTKIKARPLDTLKKSVAAIHTSGDLSLLERKTSNVLLLNAYQNLITKRTHKISVPLLCAMLGYDSHDIEKLKAALRKLASTTIEFNMMKDGKESWKVMSMISFGEIENGVCTYRYDEYLAERLYDPEIYATINMAVQRKFDSGYALTLYENCLRYKSVGSTGWWDIERFRNIMGATAPLYDEFKYLKREVVTKPLAHVNKVSDISLTPEFQKKGRTVTAIRFLIAESQQQSLISNDHLDEYAVIRDHETYKRLIQHGIGEKLALLWVKDEEQRARAVIDYVEEKDKKNQIRGSSAGYIRKLIEDKADIGPTPYEKKKSKQTQIVIDSQESEKAQEKIESEKTKALANIIQLLSQDKKKTIIERAYSDNATMLSKLLEKNERGSIMVSEYRAIAVLCKKKNINLEEI
jgi:plasmid replication initiation protein